MLKEEVRKKEIVKIGIKPIQDEKGKKKRKLSEGNLW
jgi:hypothetical protein